MNRKILVGCGTLLVLFLGGFAMLALPVWRDIARAQTPPPSIRLLAPQNNARVSLAQPLTLELEIQAGEGRTLDSVLIQAGPRALHRASPEGQNRLLLAVPWTPTRPGPITFTVVAYDDQGRNALYRFQVFVQAPENDLDEDGVVDILDDCPERPGAWDALGCPITIIPDRDGDSIPDAADWCPDRGGPVEAFGCPSPRIPEGDAAEADPMASDRDGDTVPDAEDSCPDRAGLPGHPEAPGCPDSDGDGVVDPLDLCPDTPGDASESAPRPGCPTPEEGAGEGTPEAGTADRDGDGVPDAEDLCPDEPGLGGAFAGCSLMGPDRDGDGFPDWFDMCPDTPGDRGRGFFDWGCPDSTPPPVECEGAAHPDAAWDTDGDGQSDACDQDDDNDGRADVDDLCPYTPGVGAAGSRGCHPWLPGEEDADGDGVANRADRCPLHPGSSDLSVRGCPEDFNPIQDTDGDGTPDRLDLCPGYTGLPEFLGCSPDGDDPDRDGIPWREDECPEINGGGWASGCPIPPEVFFPEGLYNALDALFGEDSLLPFLPRDWIYPYIDPALLEERPRFYAEILEVRTRMAFTRIICYGAWEGVRDYRRASLPFRFEQAGRGTFWRLPEGERPFVVIEGPLPENSFIWIDVMCDGVSDLNIPLALGGAARTVLSSEDVDDVVRDRWIYWGVTNGEVTVWYRFCYGTACPDAPGREIEFPEPLPETFKIRLDLLSVEVVNDGDPFAEGELRFLAGVLINETLRREFESRGSLCIVDQDGDYRDPAFDTARCITSTTWLQDVDINDGDEIPISTPAPTYLVVTKDSRITISFIAVEDDSLLEGGDEYAAFDWVDLPPVDWVAMLDQPKTTSLSPFGDDDFTLKVTFVLRMLEGSP